VQLKKDQFGLLVTFVHIKSVHDENIQSILNSLASIKANYVTALKLINSILSTHYVTVPLRDDSVP